MNVVVVGAGLSGLAAALELNAHGHEVVLLEGADRVGGRVHGIEVVRGVWADAGAAYLGHLHTELQAALQRFDLPTTPTVMLGDSVFALRDQKARTEGRFPPLSAVALGEMFEQLHSLTARINPHAPWTTADAATLDTTTAAQWCAENLSHPDARLFFPLFLGEMMAADPADISVLHMAFYLRSGGGLRYLNAFQGGAQEERIKDGAHRLCERMARSLGNAIRLNQRVTSIVQRDSQVRIRTSDSQEHLADSVIIAIPPLLADAITFEPALSAPRSSSQTSPGCAVKVHIVYPTPAWRQQGLSGWSVNEHGPLLSTVDDSPADGSVGILTGFVTGREALRFASLSPEAQRQQVLQQASSLFENLPDPIGYHAMDWVNAPLSRGCYAALFGPGDWLAQGPNLVRPHGLVYWAGTETSTEFFGLMEGAIRAGRRAAAEVSNNNHRRRVRQ